MYVRDNLPLQPEQQLVSATGPPTPADPIAVRPVRDAPPDIGVVRRTLGAPNNDCLTDAVGQHGAGAAGTDDGRSWCPEVYLC